MRCHCEFLSLNLEHGESGVRHYRAWLGLGMGNGVTVYGRGIDRGGCSRPAFVLLAILYALDAA